LDALLSIPVALTFDSWVGESDQSGEDEGGSRLDPVALLEALRRTAGRLSVFCQAGAIAAPRGKTFLSFLEPVVHGVLAPRGGAFHPKVWVLRYLPADEEQPPRYRVLVLSRNLTYDASWDTMLRLDGVLGTAVDPKSGSRLGRFVEGLIEAAEASPLGLDNERRSALTAMASECRRLALKLPDGVEECSLWPLGFDDTSASDVFAFRRNRTLVVSPFVTKGLVDELGLGLDDILVSRQEELAGLDEDLRDGIGRVAVLDEVATAEIDDLDAEDSTEAADSRLSGLHAKLFVADGGSSGWRSSIWTGSANATTAAFTQNVEFLVELGGLRSAIGIDKVLGADEGGLAELLVPYEHDPSLARDPEQQRLEKLMDEHARVLGSADLSLRVSGDLEDGFSLKLAAPNGIPEAPAELAVSVWPATLESHRAEQLGGSDSLPSWTGLTQVQLTGFLAVQIEAPSAALSKTVAIAIPLHGAPEDRAAAVIRSILENPEQILRYLLFLLGDYDGQELDLFEEQPEASEGVPVGFFGMGAQTTLYEALIRSLHSDPTRIDRVEELIADLGDDDGVALLPEGFAELYESVRDARKQLRT
jgi:hypothetical protein